MQVIGGYDCEDSRMVNACSWIHPIKEIGRVYGCQMIPYTQGYTHNAWYRECVEFVAGQDRTPKSHSCVYLSCFNAAMRLS